MNHILQDFSEAKEEGINDIAAAILVLAESISTIGTFRSASNDLGHELALALKNVLQESVIKTELQGDIDITKK